MSEREIQNAIMDYLRIKKIYFWRNNTGAFVDSSKHFYRFGFKGSSDILGILPGGRFLAIEVKAKYGKLRPEQEEFIKNINHYGGLAFVAKSLDDVINRI
jgi:hypothetical protein